jgi:hypothetical protein
MPDDAGGATRGGLSYNNAGFSVSGRDLRLCQAITVFKPPR